MATKRDYYEVLGFSKGASEDETKKIYRKPSKRYHPDINKESDMEEKLKEVSEAYEILSDPQKCAAYGQYGHAGIDLNYGAGGTGDGLGGFGGFSGGGFGGFEDIFDSSFGGGGRSVDPNAPRQGTDLQYTIDLSFEEATLGVEKEVKYNREEICHTYGGNGAKPDTQPTTCYKCRGAGTINVERQTLLERVMSCQICDVCHRTGKEIKEPCPICHGSGHEKKTHLVKVNVPVGAEEGQQMRLTGQGEAGKDGELLGGLYVVFRVEESDIFDRKGSEVHYELPLSFVQAALRDEVQVLTVHGDVKLRIPVGTQTGMSFRLRGKGAPKLRSGATGDQHVKIKLVVPKSLNEQQKEALRTFAEVGGIKVEKQQENGFFDEFKDTFGGKKQKQFFQ